MADRDAEAYRRMLGATRARVLAAVTAMWNSLGDYHEADAARFAGAIIPLVLAGQIRYAQLTEAYLSRQLADFSRTGRVTARGVDLGEVTGAAVRGVDPAEVYQRPAKTVWTKLSEGSDMTAAVTAGLHRATTIAATDLQLARTHTARAVMRRSGVREFRRVLTGRESCGMCVIASTQRYRVENLMPIHPGCDCGVEALEPGVEHPQVLDKETLEAAHDAIADRFGMKAADRGGRALDYRKVLLVREHGELGPVLTVKRHLFTGPGDI